jgi:lipopolysaccharide export system protein LptA
VSLRIHEITGRISLALAFGLLLAALPARAQQPADTSAARPDTSESQPVQIRAGSLRGALERSEPVRRLIGDVKLTQGQTRLWANRATQYLERSKILFVGDVLIVERGDTLRAERVLYDSRTKSGRARDSVRLTDGEVRVRAPSGRYFSREKRARFENGLTFIDSATTVTSEVGTYFSEDKRAVFQRNVDLRRPDTRMMSDSLTSWRDRETARAPGKVLLAHRVVDSTTTASDSTARMFLYGDRAFTDRKSGLSRASGRPLLIRLRPDSAGTDTLLIRAKRLRALRTDSLRRLTATDSVRIWQGGRLTAVSDSAVSTRRPAPTDSSAVRRTMRLFGDPLAWNDDTQISGDVIRFTGTGERLKRLVVPTNPFVVRPDSVTGRLNQLIGRRLVGRFQDGALRNVGTGPNAESIYFLKKEQQPNGAVKASSDSIAFVFSGDSLETIRVLGGVQGTRYTENRVPSPFRLDGFRWEPERQPRKDSLLRRLPPTLRPLPRTSEDTPAPPLVRAAPPPRGLRPGGG